jgi:hypothetical protein
MNICDSCGFFEKNVYNQSVRETKSSLEVVSIMMNLFDEEQIMRVYAKDLQGKEVLIGE